MPGPRWLLTIWTLLGLLLLAEVLLLTIRHDAREFAGRPDGPARLLAAAPNVLRIGINVTAVVLALTAWRMRGRFTRTVRGLGLTPGLWPWLPAHLVAFTLLVQQSERIFASTAPPNGQDVIAWWGAVLGTALSWLALAVAPRFWPPIIRSGRWVLVLGFVLGVGGWVISWSARSGWDSASTPTFWAADRVLRLIFPEVVSDPDLLVLGTPTFQVRIAPTCSGQEGIGLVCLYLGVYLIAFRRTLRFPHAFALIPIGVVAAWSLNVLRIAALVVIGDSVSADLALGGFHSQAGWLAFNVVALGLVFIAHSSRFFSQPSPVPRPEPDPTAAYLLPLLTIIAVQMLTAMFFNGSSAIYPIRVIAGAIALGFCWRSIDGLGVSSTRGDQRAAWRGVTVPILIGAGVFGLWVGLAPFTAPSSPTTDPRMDLAGGPSWLTGLWLFFRLAGSILLIPLVEEVAFRGYLLRRLVAADFRSVSPQHFTWPSVLISSVLFGLLHANWPAGILAGMAYAIAYYHRGKLLDAVLAHATTNGLLAVVALVSGHWQFGT